MVKVTVTITDKELQKLLKKLSDADLSEPMKDIAAYMKASVLKNFEVGGRPEKWAPLSTKYLAWKKRQGYSSKPLILTGRLRQSINTSVKKNEARVFTGMKYGVYHQTGTRKMPARPFLVVQDADIPVIKQILVNFYKKVKA